MNELQARVQDMNKRGITLSTLNFLSPNFQGLNNIPRGYAWHNFFVASGNFEAMAIYVVKQTCGNDIIAWV